MTTPDPYGAPPPTPSVAYRLTDATGRPLLTVNATGQVALAPHTVAEGEAVVVLLAEILEQYASRRNRRG